MSNINFKDIVNKVGILLGVISLLFLFSLVISLPVMWLWNSTIPELFGLKEITWWMAWKLLMLCSMLFGVFLRSIFLTKTN